MNRFKILLALLALFVLLTAPAYFDNTGTDATRGTLADGDGTATGSDYARGAYAVLPRAGKGVPS